jgi:hypothetical protein
VEDDESRWRQARGPIHMFVPCSSVEFRMLLLQHTGLVKFRPSLTQSLPCSTRTRVQASFPSAAGKGHTCVQRGSRLQVPQERGALGRPIVLRVQHAVLDTVSSTQT